MCVCNIADTLHFNTTDTSVLNITNLVVVIKTIKYNNNNIYFVDRHIQCCSQRSSLIAYCTCKKENM